MTDFLDEKRREITDRLAELGPLVEEYRRLEAAASALDGIGGGSTATATAPRRRGPGRPPGSGKKAARRGPAAKKRGRPPGRPKKVGRPKTQKSRTPGRQHHQKAAPATVAATATATQLPRRNVAPDGAKAAARVPRRRCRSCRDSPASPSPSSRRRWASSRTTCTACSPASNRKGSCPRKAAAGTLKASCPTDHGHKRARQMPRPFAASGECHASAAPRWRPIQRSNKSLISDRVALAGQLGDRGVEPGAGEVVDVQPLDDRVLTVRHTCRESRR